MPGIEFDSEDGQPVAGARVHFTGPLIPFPFHEVVWLVVYPSGSLAASYFNDTLARDHARRVRGYIVHLPIAEDHTGRHDMDPTARKHIAELPDASLMIKGVFDGSEGYLTEYSRPEVNPSDDRADSPQPE